MSKVDDACAVVRLLMNEIYAPNFGLLGVVAELFGAAERLRETRDRRAPVDEHPPTGALCGLRRLRLHVLE